MTFEKKEDLEVEVVPEPAWELVPPAQPPAEPVPQEAPAPAQVRGG